MQDMLLLSRDTVIAKIINDTLEPVAPALLPLKLQRTGAVQAWLESRAIDAHRTHSRLLKKVLRLAQRDDLTTVLAVNAATITDAYWVKPIDDTTTTYADVRFTFNRFDELALTGNFDSLNQKPSRTPELTNIGSYEKCWLLRGEPIKYWWLKKAGLPREQFSEVLASRLGRALGLSVVNYSGEDSFVRCRDFTDGATVNFEPAEGIVGETSEYVDIYEALRPYGERVTDGYLRMCYFDALIQNADRHEYNFGVLRNVETGGVISLAPFFDHNISLVSRNYPSLTVSSKDLLINDFVVLLRHADRKITMPTLSKTKIRDIIDEVPFVLPVEDGVPDPKAYVCEYVFNRQEALQERCRDLIAFQKNTDAGRE